MNNTNNSSIISVDLHIPLLPTTDKFEHKSENIPDKEKPKEIEKTKEETLAIIKELNRNSASFQISSFIYKSLILEKRKSWDHNSTITIENVNLFFNDPIKKCDDDEKFTDDEKFSEIDNIKKMKIGYFWTFSFISILQIFLLLFYSLKIYIRYECPLLNVFLICFIIQTSLWGICNVVIWLVFFHPMLYFNEIRSLMMCKAVIIIIMVLIFLNFIFSIIHVYSLEINDFHQTKQKLFIILLFLLGLIFILIMFFRFTHNLKNKLKYLFL